jgi:hypothetical protein
MLSPSRERERERERERKGYFSFLVGGGEYLMAAAVATTWSRVNDPHSNEIFARHSKGLKMKEIPRLRSSTTVQKVVVIFANFLFFPPFR